MKQSEFIEQTFVFVVDQSQKPLMPTTPERAARWMKTGKATGFWKNGLFCVRLNQPPSGYRRQPIVAAFDPGSKREGITLKSAAHTYLNIQLTAVFWVMARLEQAAQMRRTRRGRTQPYRACRVNRNQSKKAGWIPPSTFARWNLKLRVLKWLAKVIPITEVGVEDIQAATRKRRRKGRARSSSYNQNFSPLQQGKNWFYTEIKREGYELHLHSGWQTKELREKCGLVKNGKKLDERFDVHCLDSWVIANDIVGGHEKPDNTRMMYVKANPVIRRQLHKLQEGKGGVRQAVGGTTRQQIHEGRQVTFVRGSLVNYRGRGLCILGGFTGNWQDGQGTFTLNTLDGQPKYKLVKSDKFQFVAFHKWLIHFGKEKAARIAPPVERATNIQTGTLMQLCLWADFTPAQATKKRSRPPVSHPA